ncbi:MAG: zinc ribbon domain-containing protein [Chloroflexales bacterium]|nr:zinc ribbon domain-containing protein [Chloroflexales bacterium]
MPTYVYACDSCGAQFEQFQSFKDEPLRECPNCAHAIRRVFQPVGIVFKGAGWYINDSRGKSASSVAEGDKSEAKADKGDVKAAEGEAKADKGDKGEAKAETKTKAEPSEKSSEPAIKPASSATPASAA